MRMSGRGAGASASMISTGFFGGPLPGEDDTGAAAGLLGFCFAAAAWASEVAARGPEDDFLWAAPGALCAGGPRFFAIASDNCALVWAG